MSGPRLLDLNGEIDRLYQAPLGEFVSARNALAARMKAEQGKDAAQHIKALEKPNATAWVVNQLAWRHRAEVTALLIAGDAVRLVQQQRLGGADVDAAPAARSRQAAMDVLVAHAADLLKEAGQAPSPENRQRLVTTLDALATYGTGEAAPRVGRLTRDVDPPGFGALAALLPAVPNTTGEGGGPVPGAPSFGTPRPAPPKLTVVSRREQERARAAVAAAESQLEAARTRDREARDAMAAADAAWQAARREVAERQQALDRAAAAEADAVADRDQRKRDATRAAIDVRDAERALAAATRAAERA